MLMPNCPCSRCGLAAVQLAKAMDAGHIAGVCSGKNETIVKENGATEVVDYTKVDVVDHFDRQELKKFDIVFDAATNSGGGEDYREKSLKLLKKDETNHGRLIGKVTTHVVDRPTQLICISDIYCQQTNTKDIAGQSATTHGRDSSKKYESQSRFFQDKIEICSNLVVRDEVEIGFFYIYLIYISHDSRRDREFASSTSRILRRGRETKN